MNYNFYVPTRVLFGAGQLNHLHEQTMPGKKAMVVISNGKSTRENGSLDRTMNELHQAVVDPELMATVPPKFTAHQGFDALFHSTEGYILSVSSLMGDMVQLAAIENIGKYLARAVKDGSDMEARGMWHLLIQCQATPWWWEPARASMRWSTP